jgi:Tol biopolymer transport system component
MVEAFFFSPSEKIPKPVKQLLTTAVAMSAIVACVPASGATTGSFVDTSPTWAPTGTLIAFWRYDYSLSGADNGIYVIDPSGGDPRRVVADPNARWPLWSPDGGMIAYATETNAGSIQRVNLDGSGRRRLSAKLQGYMSHPQWSPDGKRIAFHLASYRRSNGRSRRYGEIWIVNPDGTRLRRVAANVPFNAGGEPVPFSWSPKSDRLVYSGVQNGIRDLWTARIDGRRQRLLRSRVFDSAPAWSPDGKRIAFTGKETEQAQIYVLTLAGRRLTVAGSGFRPRWGPSSQRLAFIGTSAGVGVYVTTVGTGIAEKLLASERGSDVPQWAPDGNALVVAAYGDCPSSSTGIYIIRAGGPTRITNPCGT